MSRDTGVIVETGGLLSHSGLLAREYGFPAAEIKNALNLIPNGATIRLNGNTGMVHILKDPDNGDNSKPEQNIRTDK